MRSLYFFILLFFAQTLAAQKVGLVLSGGGAKGLAHLGVLKALEEHDIPIHFITGTSMGGLIGGYYAAGYSVEDIEEIIYSVEFQNWVNGRTAENFNFYFASKREQADWVTLNIKVDSSFQVGLGTDFVSDLPLNFALNEMLAAPSYAANYDFDQLYVPFKAMASEIFTQESLALDSGSLSNALRATMSVPYFYRPIRYQGKFLLDGGIYNNYPIEVLKQSYEPEVIIGVNVSVKRFKQYPYGQDENLRGTSMLRMILDKPDIGEIADNEIYIEPELSAFSSFDFAQVRGIVQAGYLATKAQMLAIENRIGGRIDCEERDSARHEFTANFEPLLIKDIALQGFKKSQYAYVMRNFDRRDGRYLGINEARQKYYKLLAEDYFNSIIPEIVYREELGGFELSIRKEDKTKLEVDFGGNLSSRNISTIYMALNYSHLYYWLFRHKLNVYSGRFYNSARYETRINLPSIVPFYVEPFININQYDFLSTAELFSDRITPKAVKQREWYGGVAVATPLGSDRRLKWQYAYFNQNTRFSNRYNFISTDTLDLGIYEGNRIGLSMDHNSLNRKMYPDKGKSFRLVVDFVSTRYRHYPGSTAINRLNSNERFSYARLKASYQQYFNFNKFSFGFRTEALFSNHPILPTYWATVSTMDQYNALNDSPTLFLENFRARSYIAGGLIANYSMLNNLHWRTEAHMFKALRRVSPNADQAVELSSYLDLQMSPAAYSAIIYQSPVGPIALSANYHNDVNQNVSFMLHIGYILFNERIFE